MKRLLLCVGAAKCGTTWLYRALEQNPGIWFTPEKEVNYLFSKYGWFDRLSDEHRLEKYRVGQKKIEEGALNFPNPESWYARFLKDPVDDAWYRDLFREMPDDAWACDFSPSTSLISYEGWERTYSLADDVRYIFMMREMKDRLWSHAKFHADFCGDGDAFRKMSPEEIEDYVEQQDIVIDGDYGRHLDALLRYAPRAKVLVINYNDIKDRPEQVLRRVEQFLGLDPTPIDPALLQRRVNVSESLPMPPAFAERHLPRFRAQSKLLVKLGFSFAQDWQEAYAKGLGVIMLRAGQIWRRLLPFRFFR